MSRMLEYDYTSGLVRSARQVPSPNHDDRPSGCVAELIVVHGISLPPGEYGGHYIDQFFTNCLAPGDHAYFEEICSLQVSAHFLIRRDGEMVQYVPVHKRAWHAGASSFEGRERCNDFSVGIELEGEDGTAYEAVQYQVLAGLIQTLRAGHPALRAAAVVGHSDIAPGRKTDPGDAFDWQRLERLLVI